MVVFGNGIDECLLGAIAPKVVDVAALLASPAKVQSPRRVGGLGVDLFPFVLPNVAKVEVAGTPVEAEAPGVAQAVGPDFVPAWGVNEGIVVGDGVGCPAVHVQAQEGAKKGVDVLAMVQRVTAAAAVAQADIKVAVEGAEGEMASVVVAVGLGDGQEYLGTVGVSEVRVGRGNVVAGDHCRAVSCPGIVDIELAVGGIVGMEGQSQQSALGAGDYCAAQVEEWGAEGRAVLYDTNGAWLLDDKEAA